MLTSAHPDSNLFLGQATRENSMDNACINLLGQALLAGEQELKALNDGQVEEASVWEAERSHLTQQALILTDGVPLDTLLGALQKLCDMQKRLIEAGNELRQNWQKEFTRARGESRRLAGYKQAAAHALN